MSDPTPKQREEREEREKPGKRREGFAALYALVYPIVVEVGREHGYAMGLHGSLARDLDVIAAPWVEEPSNPADVVTDICHRLGAIVGEDLCTVPPERGPAKPHREVWTVVLQGGAFLDLSFALLRTHSPEEPVGWRPWDTCPTDHRVVLAYFEPGHIETVCRDEEGWWFAYDGDRTDRDPTHWMARPPLPIGQPLDGEEGS